MNKLNRAVDRFCYNHPRFGVPNLMRYLVVGNVIVYLLAMFSNWTAVSFLSFNLASLLHGEVWRLVTFIFVPNDTNLFFLAISLYFYYFVGNALEREWGTAKFTFYYLSGLILTLVSTIVASLITGGSYTLSGTGYINLSMFFAFAMLYPNMQVLLFFLIPLKVKWLAWADAAFFAVGAVQSLAVHDLVGWLTPLAAVLNFFVYFWPEITGAIMRRGSYNRARSAPQTIHFKRAAKAQERKAQERGYHHKCCVCGRTDTDYPDLEFRYCSKCAGYHCFCQDHIFNHVHYTEP